MVIVHIRGWDESKAFVTLEGYYAKHLERRLMQATGQPLREAKLLVRPLKRRECVSFPLPKTANPLEAYSLRGLLESMGAIVEVVDA